ncbi:MAG: FHA domain-containing protein [Firmicutes bacterium]|nr:FHA domain-containing protein [[Eubacterium] siraeum]MCM1487067.1 FHA domain-containing protein [Bacillota bacterium]
MPNMQVCPNGHYYDSDRYPQCPYCKAPDSTLPASGGEIGATMPLPKDFMQSIESGSAPASAPAAPVMEKTVRLAPEDMQTDPVVGWIVCIDGSDKGKDFRLHSGNNFVGRSGKMDITLTGKYVSSENHFCVSYDKRHDKYFAAMGVGQEMVYLNEEPLAGTNAIQLKQGDIIEVGKTKLIFIPLCGDSFHWDWGEE